MIHQASFAQLRQKFESQDLSPMEVVESALSHAEAVNPELNAFALLDRDRAYEAARQSEERWRAGKPLSAIDGMPVTIKEFAAVRGWPSRKGSVTTSDSPVAASTVFVQRIEDAGGVLIGKTRAPEFNWKGVTDSPGFGVTRNPWDVSRTPGGSSGGCAAAVAAGVVRVSMGSDAGGSVRIPAAFTGTVALKPTFGRIPLHPFPAVFNHLPHVGPIAASVDDLASMMDVVAGPSHLDWTSVGIATHSPTGQTSKLRIGVLGAAHWKSSEPPVKDGMREVLDLISDSGFELQEVEFGVGGASEIGAFLYRQGCLAALRAIDAKDHHRLDPGFVKFALSVADTSTQTLLNYLHQRDAYASQLSEIFGEIDVLILPTMPTVAFEAGRNVPPDWPSDDWMSWNPFTPAFNATKVPALSYPIVPKGSSLPIGVQFVAAHAREDQLLTMARWLEGLRPIKLAPGHDRPVG